MKKGILYGVSVGPGDPELITVKAVRIIKETRIIAAPMTKGEKTLALDIAKGAVNFDGKTILPISFSMTKDKEELQRVHQKIADTIMEYLEKGENVAMLNLGDVSIYSTFSYIQAIVVASGFESEMIAGVPSFCAVAASLNLSLTTMEESLHIIPTVHSKVEDYISLKGTKVLMKTASSFNEVKADLIRLNVANKATMIQNCGLTDQKICRDLSQNADDNISYFTTIIVKD
ncbi:MAG: precorrin-2 C(20)-methyltransferase [Oscillospiraceae bacterium]